MDLYAGKDKADPKMVLTEQMLNRTIATSSCFWQKYLVGWGTEDRMFAIHGQDLFFFFLKALEANDS